MVWPQLWHSEPCPLYPKHPFLSPVITWKASRTWVGPWHPFIWSGKLWSVLVTSHWRLSHLLSGSLISLFHILTVSMMSRREQKSLHNQLIQCEWRQSSCVPGWPRSSSLMMGALLDLWGGGQTQINNILVALPVVLPLSRCKRIQKTHL